MTRNRIHILSKKLNKNHCDTSKILPSTRTRKVERKIVIVAISTNMPSARKVNLEKRPSTDEEETSVRHTLKMVDIRSITGESHDPEDDDIEPKEPPMKEIKLEMVEDGNMLDTSSDEESPPNGQVIKESTEAAEEKRYTHLSLMKISRDPFTKL